MQTCLPATVLIIDCVQMLQMVDTGIHVTLLVDIDSLQQTLEFRGSHSTGLAVQAAPLG